jgi:DNA polymerase I
MESPPKTLFLLDAYALIYRAHFAFTKSPRINSKGHNTSVPFGFTNTLLEVLQKQKPTHIAVAFDTAAPTFRDEIFEEYKATRQETPEDVRYGIPKVKEIIHGFSIPIIEMDGFEADDIIGTLAKKAASRGFEVYMMTPDKDFGQLVDEHVFLYKPSYMGNAVDIMGVQEVCEKWDIESVSQVTDILGLQGDSSDNIPGIPGIGPKTAAALLKKYNNVENVVKHASELKGKQKELVESFGEQAILSKKLATIITDVPVEFSLEALAYKGPNPEILKPIFNELEFKTISSRVFNDGISSPSTSKPAQLSMFDSVSHPRESVAEEIVEKRTFSPESVTYQIVTTNQARKKLVTALSHQPVVAIEVTANYLSGEPEIEGVAFSMARGEAFYIPASKDYPADLLIREFSTILNNEQITKVGHNLKASILALKIHKGDLTGKMFDSMLAHYLIEPEASHELSILCTQYLDYDLLSESSGTLADRACERVDQSLPLREKLNAELAKRGHSKLMSDVEMPLVSVLASMEYEGVTVDVETLLVMSDELRNESEKVQAEIFNLAGTQFNIGSPKQLGEVLFEEMKLLEKPKKTKSGQYATGEEVLLALASQNEIARKILDFREYEKLRSTYVDALPRMISKRDGRIHTDYRQAWAVTGRLSSNNPNLQNIPIRTEKGRAIRKAFVARNENFRFMSADYSQIELRIAASFANDTTMIEAFRTGRDIHTTTAAKVFKVPIEQVDQNMRRKAKEVNFGILYGSTAFGLAQNLGISRSEAAEIIASYFDEFPAIKRYMDDAINKARELHYVETILGRRRYLRDINSRNITTRGFAERNAINAPIQGSAADIIKIAMVNIQSWMQKEKLKSRMIMQVHDELVFDVHQDEVEAVRDNVVDLMKTAATLEVPMEVEAGVGSNWLEAH